VSLNSLSYEKVLMNASFSVSRLIKE